MVMVFFILLNYGDFLLTKIGCFRLTLFGDYLLTLTFVTLPNINYLKNESTTDPITDPISDLGLEIMKALKLNPGISTIKLTELIQANMPFVNRDMIKNELKRNLTTYVEHRGSNKAGGYYLKSKNN